jgi:hypothetical protein
MLYFYLGKFFNNYLGSEFWVPSYELRVPGSELRVTSSRVTWNIVKISPSPSCNKSWRRVYPGHWVYLIP